MKKIIVAGSLNMDIVIKVEAFAKEGETIHGSEYFTAPGGKGANQAIAASRMGGHVFMAGVLGKDAYGDDLFGNLLENGVNADLIQREDENTGTAFVTVDKKGANSIVIISGANAKLNSKQIDAVLKSIKPGDIALTQLESPPESVLHFLKQAQKKGATCVLNPSPIQHISKELLKYTDILILNEIEAQKIVGGSDKESEETILKKLLDTGVSSVIMTVGEKGAIFAKHSSITRYPTIKVKPVDTTAAGDAFVGGFLAALSNDLSFTDAIKYGNICGALSTTKLGAQPSLPTKYEVEQKLLELN